MYVGGIFKLKKYCVQWKEYGVGYGYIEGIKAVSEMGQGVVY